MLKEEITFDIKFALLRIITNIAKGTMDPTEVKFVNAVTAGGSVNFVASGVNFSTNNATYNINESTKYILS